jgi:hypothetical protein
MSTGKDIRISQIYKLSGGEYRIYSILYCRIRWAESIGIPISITGTGIDTDTE